jgi:hypothetical protein
VLAALLPQARFDAVRFRRLVALQDQVAAAGGIEPEVWPRLALLVLPAETEAGDAGLADAVADRLKLSNAQRLRLAGLLVPPPFDWPAIADAATFRQALYRHGAERTRDHVMLAALADPARFALAGERVVAAATWQRPVFPVRGADLLALGFAPSPTISGLLKELEAWWAADGFRADRSACLQRLQIIDATKTGEGNAGAGNANEGRAGEGARRGRRQPAGPE